MRRKGECGSRILIAYIMKTQPIDPFLGKIIRGYRLEELLGRGNLTAVYRARTEELWQVPELIITILLVPDTLSEQARERFRARFMRDARRLALLRHQFLLPLYGYGEQDGLFYLLTPPMQGETLTQRLRQKGYWSLLEIATLLTPLTIVLDFIHSQGLVCQFFHPANVIFQSDQPAMLSGLELPQLLSMAGLENEAKAETDGVTGATYEHLKSVTGTFLGVPEYLAPEVVKGAQVDSRADVYALGILLFELLSGTPPFTGKSYLEIAQKHVREPLPSLHETTPNLPIALEMVINRALHRNPDRRFQTLTEFIAAYTHAIEGHINTPKQVSLMQIVRSLRVPEPDKTTGWKESGFLLEGEDTLFPDTPAPPTTKEVITEDIDISGTALIPSPANKPVPIAEHGLSSLIQASVPQQAEHREVQTVVSSEADDKHQMEQATKLVSMSAMVSQLQTLKQRLEAQSIAHAPKYPPDEDKKDGQKRPRPLYE